MVLRIFSLQDFVPRERARGTEDRKSRESGKADEVVEAHCVG